MITLAYCSHYSVEYVKSIFQVGLGNIEDSKKCQELGGKWVRSITVMEMIASIKKAFAERKIYNICLAVQA